MYHHFKGGLYAVLGEAVHTETGEELVIYLSVEEPTKIHARPKEMFYGHVERDGYSGPRFYRRTECHTSESARRRTSSTRRPS